MGLYLGVGGAIVLGIVLALVIRRRRRAEPRMQFRRGGCGGNPELTD